MECQSIPKRRITWGPKTFINLSLKRQILKWLFKISKVIIQADFSHVLNIMGHFRKNKRTEYTALGGEQFLKRGCSEAIVKVVVGFLFQDFRHYSHGGGGGRLAKSSGVNLARIVVCNLLFTNKENENLLFHNSKMAYCRQW